ncbi:MAG: competence/damage-inducible protein A, partial [Pseudomonadota bacterium]
SVLPTLTGGQPLVSRTLRIDRGEGDIAGPLGQLAEAHPELNIGCYPFQKDGRYGANVVIRGVDAGQVDSAIAELSGTFPA